MKNLRFLFLLLIFLATFSATQGQVFKNIGKRIEQKIKQRADQKVDNGINKGLDKTEDAIKNSSKESNSEKSNKNSPGKKQDKSDQQKVSSDFKANTKFDFVAGDKVIALDNFSRVNVGDFPERWNTNGSGEVVSIDGQAGKWLEMKSKFTYYPEFIKSMPDNFTIEFDLIYNYPQKQLAKNILGVYFISADKSNMKEPVFQIGFNDPGNAGGAIELVSEDPYDMVNIFNWKNKHVDLNTQVSKEADFIKLMWGKSFHISIWRQKDRLRMYLNDKKIVDVPKILEDAGKINMFKFGYYDWGIGGLAYITNFRFAESVPDMRSKLLNEGKFITSGIYFNSGSEKVRPASYGILRAMAEILKSDASVKIKIVGHTDNDGSSETNLTLSKKRAESVKNILVKEYGISEGRIESDGLGQSKPVSANTTEVGKANNRRVEFIKL